MQKPRLLDQVRHACRVRHYSPRTEKILLLNSGGKDVRSPLDGVAGL